MPGSIDDALERDADPSPADTASASLGLGRLAAEGVDGAYARTLQQHMSRFKHYPRIARRRGWQGQPVVRFSLDREGALLRVELETSSGHKILDQAALDTVKKSVPFPKIPEGMESSTLSFKLPVQFVLDEL